MKKWFAFIKDRYINPQYPFRDRLYFLFGTAGLISAGAAFVAAIASGLPKIAAAASLASFGIMLAIMTVSFFMKDISINRIICSIFLNFFMFPVLFWVTGGVNCGMVFYFILGLSVSTLILDGKIRAVILALSMAFYTLCLYFGFACPELAYPLSYEERWMDTLSSFLIVALFIVAVILIVTMEYQKEHRKALDYNAQLERISVTDALTTLYNQRFLMSTLTALIEEYGAHDTPLSIAMFDIDNFKQVNDRLGHIRGDQVLTRFSMILKQLSNAEYFPTRYGGEEFIVIMPGKTLQEAYMFAEHVRAYANADRGLRELVQKEFSVSGGVAVYQPHVSAADFVSQADKKLYEAKNTGKNKVLY